jgi:hypothetical protein
VEEKGGDSFLGLHCRGVLASSSTDDSRQENAAFTIDLRDTGIVFVLLFPLWMTIISVFLRRAFAS